MQIVSLVLFVLAVMAIICAMSPAVGGMLIIVFFIHITKKKRKPKERIDYELIRFINSQKRKK